MSNERHLTLVSNEEPSLLQRVAAIVELPVDAEPVSGLVILAFEDETGGAYTYATLGGASTAERIGLLEMTKYDLMQDAEGYFD